MTTSWPKPKWLVFIWVVNIFHNNTFLAGSSPSSVTQGQLGAGGGRRGVGKSLNWREKNSGEEKSRTRKRAPGDSVSASLHQLQNVSSNRLLLFYLYNLVPRVFSLTRLLLGSLLFSSPICTRKKKRGK